MKLTAFFIALWTLLPAAGFGQDGETDRFFFAVPTSCLKPRARPNVCSFYRECLNVALPCTYPNYIKYEYAITYGEKYCNKFSEIRGSLSDLGKTWLDATRLCLQEAIDMEDGRTSYLSGRPFVVGSIVPKMSCATVRRIEFNTHPSCYLGGPAQFSRITHPSVCELPYRDQVAVILRVDIADAMTSESITQMVIVANACLKALGGDRVGGSSNAFTGAFSEDGNFVTSSISEREALIALWTWKRQSWIAKSQGLAAPNPPAIISNDIGLPQGIEPIPQGPAVVKAAFVNWEYYLRHRNFVAEISRRNTELDQQDSIFNIVPGLSDIGGVSLESKNFPGYFLRHNNFILKLQKRDGSQLFDQDATFYPRPAPEVPAAGAVVFESFNFPGYYIRHKNFKVYLEAFQYDNQFRQDASFFVIRL